MYNSRDSKSSDAVVERGYVARSFKLQRVVTAGSMKEESIIQMLFETKE